tara:strand:+ start:71 stop:244 length:174 start_codon:yes stop_codon:yes gene_type:complete
MSTNNSDRKRLFLLRKNQVLLPKDPEFEIMTTDAPEEEVFDTVSGTYNGTEFVSSTD